MMKLSGKQWEVRKMLVDLLVDCQKETTHIFEADAKVISKRKGYPLQLPLAQPHTGGRADYQAVSPPVQEGLGVVVR